MKNYWVRIPPIKPLQNKIDILLNTSIRSVMGLILFFLGLGFLVMFVSCDTPAKGGEKIVQMARIQVDPGQLEPYKMALKEEIEASIQLEPGVLSLMAVAETDNPANITILEVYANETAYKAHLESPHFKKYKSSTQAMVLSLELVKADPILLGIRGK